MFDENLRSYNFGISPAPGSDRLLEIQLRTAFKLLCVHSPGVDLLMNSRGLKEGDVQSPTEAIRLVFAPRLF